MHLMLLLLIAAAMDTPEDVGSPGVYCAYDAVSSVNPPGEVRTIVWIEGTEAAPTVRFQVTWPHSFRVLTGGGPAEQVGDPLALEFVDGWGNPVRGSVTSAGDLSFEFRGPAPTSVAEDMRIFGSPAPRPGLGACPGGK